MPSKSRKQNGGSKRRSPPKSTTVTHSTEPVETAPVETTPVETVAVETVAVETAPVETAPVSKQRAGGRKRAKKTAPAPVVESVTETVSLETEQVTEAFTETATATETSGDRRSRSFKVLLPNSTEYEGRFTGLTPYQAANKALSKYYRETTKPKKEIQFSIRESTRGSKRSVYTYNGRREKLKTPVEYSIKDGRTIVKHYKNRLTKVKKAELTSVATA